MLDQAGRYKGPSGLTISSFRKQSGITLVLRTSFRKPERHLNTMRAISEQGGQPFFPPGRTDSGATSVGPFRHSVTRDSAQGALPDTLGNRPQASSSTVCPGCQGPAVHMVKILQAVHALQHLPAVPTVPNIIRLVQSNPSDHCPSTRQIEKAVIELASGRSKVAGRRVLSSHIRSGNNTYHIHLEATSSFLADSILGTSTASLPISHDIAAANSNTATTHTFTTADTQLGHVDSPASSPHSTRPVPLRARQDMPSGNRRQIAQQVIDDNDNSDDEVQAPPRKRNKRGQGRRRIDSDSEDEAELLATQQPQSLPLASGDTVMEVEPAQPVPEEQQHAGKHMDITPDFLADAVVQEPQPQTVVPDSIGEEQVSQEPDAMVGVTVNTPIVVPNADVVVHCLGQAYGGPAPEGFNTGFYDRTYLVGYSATKTVVNRSGASTAWKLLIGVENMRPLFQVTNEIGYTYIAPELPTAESIAVGVPDAHAFGFADESVQAAIYAISVADFEARRQVNASGEQVLVERPESAAVTPSRSVQVGMQPTLEVAVDLPQQAQPAHLAMQWQESQAGNNAWSRVSDSTLTYELIERSLRQRGHGDRIDMTLSGPLQDIKGTPSSEIRPEVACLLVRGLAASSHAESDLTMAQVRAEFERRAALWTPVHCRQIISEAKRMLERA